MKRQASIQNFFAKKQSVNRPVSDSAEVDCASNNVSSGVANTSTVDPASVAEDFNQLYITYLRSFRKNIDLSQAIENATSVLDLLSKQRVNANDKFKILYAQVKEIAAKLDIKEEIPRVCRLQTARNNVPYSTEEEYYRRAVYVPYLDDFFNSLKECFESYKKTVASLQHILSEFCTKTYFYLLEAAFNFYEEDLSHKEVV
ncbi:hypothetical protein AVEN_179270-1 [Araneus ventricosus]|uniref:Uncharacterized protein n=1 Tax=Araneus ventricosus TaxID=182803 RepID=A0A4Y2K6A9_ARAVE|nr:hypothetical protein AVEN_179270-1 [Araneus ventricosus]